METETQPHQRLGSSDGYQFLNNNNSKENGGIRSTSSARHLDSTDKKPNEDSDGSEESNGSVCMEEGEMGEDEEEDEDADEDFQPDEAELSSEDLSLEPGHRKVNNSSISIGQEVAEFDANGMMVFDEQQRQEEDLFTVDNGSDGVREVFCSSDKQNRNQREQKGAHSKEVESLTNCEDISTSAALHRELRNLNFKNPGQRCTLASMERDKRQASTNNQKQSVRSASIPTAYVARRPKRSIRKRTRAQREGRFEEKERIRHNNKGKLVISGNKEVDLCDCLDPKCEGCQYQCKKCGGNKCSHACRVNRSTFIAYIDELGAGRTNNPYL